MTGVSVIICCHNSECRLPETLKHLLNQHFTDTINWEVVFVDNNSTDNSIAIAKGIWQDISPENDNLVIVKEDKPGLSEARLRGVSEAKYDYIVFCDDDNWLSNNYIQNCFNLLASDFKIGAIGGENIGVGEIQFPVWWDLYKENFAVGKQGSLSGDISDRKFIWGAGMATRKQLYLQCFSPKFPSLLKGRTGSNLNSGDDSEYCARLLLLGFKLHFDQSLHLKHFIPSQRLSESYLKSIINGHERSFEVLKKYYFVIENSNLSVLKKIRRTINSLDYRRNKLIFQHIYFLWMGKCIWDTEMELIINFKVANRA